MRMFAWSRDSFASLSINGRRSQLRMQRLSNSKRLMRRKTCPPPNTNLARGMIFICILTLCCCLACPRFLFRTSVGVPSCVVQIRLSHAKLCQQLRVFDSGHGDRQIVDFSSEGLPQVDDM